MNAWRSVFFRAPRPARILMVPCSEDGLLVTVPIRWNTENVGIVFSVFFVVKVFLPELQEYADQD
jgi:hypothetical protein